MTDEATLCIAMERLFKHGVPRSRFKVRTYSSFDYTPSFQRALRLIFPAQGSASVRLMAADADAADEFDFTQSSVASAAQTDSSQAQDTALLWDDLLCSHEPEFSPIISAQYGHDSTLLNDHHIDEYPLDDEGEWMQDRAGDWIWRASEHLMHFDLDTDEHGPRADSDLEDFPSDSSQDLKTPSQSFSPNMIDRHHEQISAETMDPDRDRNCEAKSQDYGAEFMVPSTPNTPDYTPSLYRLAVLSSNPTRQEQPSNSSARHQLPHSEPAYLNYPINYYTDAYADRDANSDILDDFDYDVPGLYPN
jgi:hypothetical protein